VLDYVGSFSILIAVIFYFAGAGDRLKQKHYQAWQVINTAQGQRGSGGRIEALQELNEDHVPLVGVDVDGAYLQNVNLSRADLKRSDFHAADLRGAVLHGADLDEASLYFANLRCADLSSANLTDVHLNDADLNGARLASANMHGMTLDRADLRTADLQGIRGWRSIKSLRLADVHGVRNAPEEFVAWALQMGAVDIADDGEWNRALAAGTTRPATGPATR